MPGRSTQQNLRNFVLRLEPLAVVNAERLFGNIKIPNCRIVAVTLPPALDTAFIVSQTAATGLVNAA